MTAVVEYKILLQNTILNNSIHTSNSKLFYITIQVRVRLTIVPIYI